MTRRIFRSILLVSLGALLACLLIVTIVLYEHFTAIQKSRLKTELALALTGVEQNKMDYLNAIDTDGYRLTWIAANGAVFFDSKADSASMESHSDREEILEALQSGSGESERYSTTLTEKTLYAAALLSDGTVLRISIENATVVAFVLDMLQPMLLVCLLLLIVSGVLASRMAKRIVKPLNELDLEHPLESDAYDELSPLLRRINRLCGQVDGQLRDLRRKTDEFEQITGSMNEGLVLLDDKGVVVSINRAALKLFGMDESCVGSDFFIVDRSHEISAVIDSALSNGHGETRIRRNGCEYQVDASRIASQGSVVGAVLLSFDVTDRVFAERNRREFTANVSHELKTPLQSIMGSAELLENGLVKPADIPRFAGHIRTESARLVALIEDIIRLSQLDEKDDMPREEVDLYEIASETVEALRYAAEARSLTVRLTGEKTLVGGVRKLLSQIVFNLCDNAIKYNIDGGQVDISVHRVGDEAVLTVRDTGIGIPPEHQSRIFERFYRVDKSHSKESGGTGLGLSIVKHAAAYHHGTAEVQSEPQKGSEFVVRIPAGGDGNAVAE